ncbi:MAG: DNA methyltransferase [Desulfobacteraceae bacterium]
MAIVTGLLISKAKSFVEDAVLDPFCNSGTSMVAALKCGRNSVGIVL